MGQKHAIITEEEMLSALKSPIGVEYTPKDPWFNTAATPDSIRHFAHGIGDDAPLECTKSGLSTLKKLRSSLSLSYVSKRTPP